MIDATKETLHCSNCNDPAEELTFTAKIIKIDRTKENEISVILDKSFYRKLCFVCFSKFFQEEVVKFQKILVGE